ncbi:MAG TPA: hypothetical protein VMW24_13390 [Sedimentisphaerales bacterium]|nr:hypothetical protein [Sedimentisphaerales bacterium]
MKDNQSENERLANLLRTAHLSEPSPMLKERITTEARKTWNQSSLELSWSIPLRHLAASAAAAVVIIWLANYSSDRALGRWRAASIQAAIEQSADIDALPELPYGPFAKRLVSVNRRSLAIDGSSLSDHVAAVRQVLDEARQNGAPAPAGRSRLIPDRAGANSYS